MKQTSKVRDRFWIWGHEAGSHNSQYGLKGLSRMTPAEGAYYLGVPNAIMVRYKGKPTHPFDQQAIALSPLEKVVWSTVGAGGETEENELERVLDLARRFTNICGIQMDDFFYAKPDEKGRIAVHTPEELEAMKKRLMINGRRLDLWVTVYTTNLDIPKVERSLQKFDVLTYWTWKAKELNNLEQNFDRLEHVGPSARKVLGCYMWDYGDHKPIPISLMELQCELGLKWLNESRIEGMVFLASCICDLGLEAVEWTRRWIRQVGRKKLD